MEEKIERAFEFLKDKNYTELRKVLITMEPADIVTLLEEAEESNIYRIFRILPKELAAETFAEMDPDMQESLINTFNNTELSEILDEMFLDDTVDMIEEMPAAVVKRIMRVTKPSMRTKINKLMNYPEDSAGSIMTIEYVDLKKYMTVSEAFTRIRKQAVDKETIYTCYVTDEKRHLIGVCSAKDLMISQPDILIGDIMDPNIIYVHTHDDKEDAARLIDKYGFLAMPVVDNEERLVGIITVDDALDVIQEETDEDIAIMAAVTPTEDEYLKTSVFNHAKHRILWLLILMLSATFTGIIITNFEEAMSALLVSFLPMLMDTGGNCGAQASAMIIRGLATAELTTKDFLKVWWKEVRIALMVGAALAVVNAGRVWLMYAINPSMYGSTSGAFDIWKICFVVGVTIMGAVALAKSLGCCLPMLAKKLKLDPAIMASPLITTIVDACTVLLYFNVAIWVQVALK